MWKLSVLTKSRQAGVLISLLALCCIGLLSRETAAHDAVAHDFEGAAHLTGPQDLILAFRETGDDHYLDQAWENILPLLQQPDVSADTLVLAATLAQSRHDFDTSLALLDRALETAPRLDQAWLLKSNVHLVRGQVEAARLACRRLDPSGVLVIVTCHARLALLEDGFQRYREALEILLTRNAAIDSAAGEYAWALATAGDLAAVAGDLEQAGLRYAQSLELVDLAQTRAVLMDVLLERGKPCEAFGLADGGTTSLALAVRRLIAEADCPEYEVRSGDIEHLDRTFRDWIAVQDYLHAREMARFYLDVLPRPQLAQRIAAKNFEMQREPEDRRLLERTRLRF